MNAVQCRRQHGYLEGKSRDGVPKNIEDSPGIVMNAVQCTTRISRERKPGAGVPKNIEDSP